MTMYSNVVDRKKNRGSEILAVESWKTIWLSEVK